MERWPVEIFFRQSKNKLAFDRYQIRSSKGIRSYSLLMSLAHLIAYTGCGKTMSFENGSASSTCAGQDTSFLRKFWL
ncbi:MAG: hypothetical protein HFH72_00260 [Lachnospiraceae bacterium]|nr:hypothetical protein [Lachnospiraceae bacterium]